MIEIKEHFDFLFDIYNWFNSLPSAILSLIIVALIGVIIIFSRHYRNTIANYNQIHSTISSEMFNIKQGNVNTANLTVYPVKSHSPLPNFQWKYSCSLVINPYDYFGDNFAIRLRSKSMFSISDANDISINSTNIGGFNTVHLNEVYFETSLINYHSILFNLHTNTDLFDFDIEIINENVHGNYKFIFTA